MNLPLAVRSPDRGSLVGDFLFRVACGSDPPNKNIPFTKCCQVLLFFLSVHHVKLIPTHPSCGAAVSFLSPNIVRCCRLLFVSHNGLVPTHPSCGAAVSFLSPNAVRCCHLLSVSHIVLVPTHPSCGAAVSFLSLFTNNTTWLCFVYNW